MARSDTHLTTKTQWARHNWGLALSAIILILAFSAMVRLDWQYGSLRGAQAPQTITWYLLAFAAYIAGLIWVERRSASMRWIWLFALCFRLLLLLTTPTLSDDVYRYLWDGHVANKGVSPYAYPIDSPSLDHLHTAVRAQANNRWMASPYLPGAQILFSTITGLFPLQPFYFQAAMVLFDLAGAWLIAHLLALAELPRRRLYLYLWNPLVVVEVAHGAHVDAWMVFLALVAISLTLKQSRISPLNVWPLAPIILALATLTKLLPLLLLPVLFWYWDWRQRILYAAAGIGLLVPSALRAGWGLTGQLTGRGLFGAIRIYSAQWNFNSGLFRLLQEAFGASVYGPPAAPVKTIIALAMALVALAIFWEARPAGYTTRRLRTALRLMAAPLMAYMLLTPTLHPWYALLLLAFLPFLPPARREKRIRWLLALPWLYLSGALVFSYLTYLDPQHFGELAWVLQLEWLPLYLLLIVAIAATLKLSIGDQAS